ncbi:MAG: STAS domain-containing protein [Spirochaetaceae bacterium]|jgi:anti-sigma B factor antagonist|nr:STAS domain-containing protein [Spirochaetaceae bacterium]
MTIQSERLDKSSLLLSLSGRLDTATAPQLERKLKQWGDDIKNLTFDFSELTYVSSMGLRVLLQTQKVMNATGRRLAIQNIPPAVREVFEMTGFISLMAREEKFVVIRKDEPGGVVLSLIGQMDEDDVALLENEFVHIRNAHLMRKENLLVTLDMERLTFVSNSACRALKQVIAATAFEKRNLAMRRAAPEVYYTLASEGLENYAAREDGTPYA